MDAKYIFLVLNKCLSNENNSFIISKYQQHSSHLTTAVDPGFVLFSKASMPNCSAWRHLLSTHFDHIHFSCSMSCSIGARAPGNAQGIWNGICFIFVCLNDFNDCLFVECISIFVQPCNKIKMRFYLRVYSNLTVKFLSVQNHHKAIQIHFFNHGNFCQTPYLNALAYQFQFHLPNLTAPLHVNFDSLRVSI